MPTAVRPLLLAAALATGDAPPGAEGLSPILGFQLSSLRYARQREMVTDTQFAAHVANLMGSFVSRQALRVDPANPKQALSQGTTTDTEDGDGPAAICRRRSLSRSRGSSRAGSPGESVTPRGRRTVRTPRQSLAWSASQRGSPSGTPRVHRLSVKLETPNPARGGIVGGWLGAALRAQGTISPRGPLPAQRTGARARDRVEESSNPLHGGTAARWGTSPRRVSEDAVASPRRASEDAVNRRESDARATASAAEAATESALTTSSGCAVC